MKRIDWVSIGIIFAVPFMLLLYAVSMVAEWVIDYLVPAPIRSWFSVRFCTPYVMFKWGIIPIYKPYDKWDCTTQ